MSAPRDLKRSLGALMTLIDFTLSNARRFYSSMGNPSNMKGLKGKAAEGPLSRAVYVRFYLSKVKDKQEKQVTYTYHLIKAKGFMEAIKWNKEKIDIIRW